MTLADYVPDDQEEKREILVDLALIIDLPQPSPSAHADLDPAQQLDALRGLRDYLAATGLGRGDHMLQASMRRLEEVLDEFLN